MNICKAARLAQTKGTGIYRTSIPGIITIPTNTHACCMGVHTKGEKAPYLRWQPKLDDLVATDWQVYGQLKELGNEIDDAH